MREPLIISNLHLDMLKEIGNIGSGHAATSLSILLDKPVTVSVPNVRILDYDEVIEHIGGPEQLMVGLLLFVGGDITGMIMFLLNKDFAHMTLQTLTGGELTETAETSEMDQSAMKEIGNIMASSYANALSELSGLKIHVSVPNISIDMAGAIISAPSVYYENISSRIMLIESGFNGLQGDASSHVLLIPEEESLRKILKCLEQIG